MDGGDGFAGFGGFRVGELKGLLVEGDGVFGFAGEFGGAGGGKKEGRIFWEVAAQPFAGEGDGGCGAVLRDAGGEEVEDSLLGLRFEGSGGGGALFLEGGGVERR